MRNKVWGGGYLVAHSARMLDSGVRLLVRTARWPAKRLPGRKGFRRQIVPCHSASNHFIQGKNKSNNYASHKAGIADWQIWDQGDLHNKSGRCDIMTRGGSTLHITCVCRVFHHITVTHGNKQARVKTSLQTVETSHYCVTFMTSCGYQGAHAKIRDSPGFSGTLYGFSVFHKLLATVQLDGVP